MHPVGLALFGEVSVQTSVRAAVYGGSDVRLNATDPRFKQIIQLINILTQALPTPKEQKMELEIFVEAVKTTMFPTRIMQEQGGAILLEDSNEFMTNRGQTSYLVKKVLMEQKRVLVSYQLLIFPRSPTPMTNIDATMVLLKQIVLLLKNVSVQADVEIPSIVVLQHQML